MSPVAICSPYVLSLRDHPHFLSLRAPRSGAWQSARVNSRAFLSCHCEARFVSRSNLSFRVPSSLYGLPLGIRDCHVRAKGALPRNDVGGRPSTKELSLRGLERAEAISESQLSCFPLCHCKEPKKLPLSRWLPSLKMVFANFYFLL